MFCSYYRARVEQRAALFLVAMLKSIDHLCFDRSYEEQEGIFEFFVPHEMEQTFEKLIALFQKTGEITEFQKLPNRLANSSECV